MAQQGQQFHQQRAVENDAWNQGMDVLNLGLDRERIGAMNANQAGALALREAQLEQRGNIAGAQIQSRESIAERAIAARANDLKTRLEAGQGTLQDKQEHDELMQELRERAAERLLAQRGQQQNANREDQQAFRAGESQLDRQAREATQARIDARQQSYIQRRNQLQQAGAQARDTAAQRQNAIALAKLDLENLDGLISDWDRNPAKTANPNAWRQQMEAFIAQRNQILVSLRQIMTPQPTTQPAMPTTQPTAATATGSPDPYDLLPPGSIYTAPDGTQRRKR